MGLELPYFHNSTHSYKWDWTLSFSSSTIPSSPSSLLPENVQGQIGEHGPGGPLLGFGVPGFLRAVWQAGSPVLPSGQGVPLCRL